MNEEKYTNWLSENEETLKEEFLMQYTHQQLRDIILESDGECVFEWREHDFEQFKKEQYNLYCEVEETK